MTETPKCHFCGGNTVIEWLPIGLDDDATYWVACRACRAPGPGAGTREEAVAAYLDFNPSWRPMETAPKDGTWVLIRYDDEDDYHADNGDPFIAAFDQEDQFWVVQGGLEIHPDYVDGWLPLPKG